MLLPKNHACTSRAEYSVDSGSVITVFILVVFANQLRLKAEKDLHE